MPIITASVFGALLFNPLLTNLEQRNQVNSLKQKIEYEKASSQENSSTLNSWKDAEFIKKEARIRLGYSLPNEKLFKVKE